MNCQTIYPLLSEYIDNALSARDTWRVDAHLAECNACVRALNEMRQTVRLVAEMPRFEVDAEFTEKLQSRLATIEPDRPRVAWLGNIRQLFRPKAIPVWGAAACGLALIILLPRSPHDQVEVQPIGAPPRPSIVQTARNQSVALAAANPLGDPAAAALIAANSNETGESVSGAQ